MFVTARRRIFISSSLSVLACVLAVIGRKPWSVTAAAAMLVSTLADCMLAGYPPAFKRLKSKGFYAGGVCFMLAHSLYTAAVIRTVNSSLVSLFVESPAPFYCYIALCALHWLVFGLCMRSVRKPGFGAAAAVYLLSVGLHAAAATSVCACSGGRIILPSIGAGLFFLSDCILLGGRYGGLKLEHSKNIVWGTYLSAQACLMIGFYLA